MTVTRERFNRLITEEIRKLAEEGTEVSLHRIPKNNGIVLDAVTIMPRGQNLAPSIYLESYYREFRAGTPVRELAAELLAESGEYAVPSRPIDPEEVTGFEAVRTRLRFRVINRGLNEEMLRKVPHETFLDLAKIFYYIVDVRGIENASAIVNYRDLRRWGITEEELSALAGGNTPAQEPARLDSIRNVLGELLAGQGGEELPPESMAPMYVLTNRSRIYGASCLLYDGVLQTAAEGMEADLFVLPSSIHELILLPDSGQFSGEELEAMVTSINAEHVLPTEVLSNHVYHYSRSERRLTAAFEK